MSTSTSLVEYVVIGFLAQLVDGALGMAYGITATSLLLGIGASPVVASATVHMAECFTTGASAISHHAMGNIDRALFRRLLLPAVIGAVLGAFVLTRVDGEAIKPWVAVYLALMGCIILGRALFPPRIGKAMPKRVGLLGFFGAGIDAVGGGGWGPIVTSNLLARGGKLHLTVGSVNAVEFFVTFASTVVFFATLGLGHWKIVMGLALGGVLAAPLGALAVKHIPPRPMLFATGLLILFLSGRTLYAGHAFAVIHDPGAQHADVAAHHR